MPGEYASFAMRAVSLGRKRGRPPVLSSNAFYPFAAERRLASLLKAELARSVRESLASALGRLSDDGDGDGWTEGFLSGTDRAASEIVLNAREAFSRFSEMTVGTPYYPPDVEERVKDDWKAEFLACCRSADSDAKADIARALTEAKERGWNRAQAEAAVLERLDPKYAKRAELIARTETGKLNNAATMATYRSAGVEYYVWLATPDERTRPSHAALNGKICAVGDPDRWYEDNPDDPLRPVAHERGKDMYHGDPGTDFQCRCTSIPWDPRIDSKYKVRKVPEPERKPTELETAMAETEKARGELEEAMEREKKAVQELKAFKAKNYNLEKALAAERAEYREPLVGIVKSLADSVDEKTVDRLTIPSLKAIAATVPDTFSKVGLERFKRIAGTAGEAILGYDDEILFVNTVSFNNITANPKEFFKESVKRFAKRNGLREFAIDSPGQVNSHLVNHEIGHFIFGKYRSRGNTPDELALIKKEMVKTGEIDRISYYAKEDKDPEELFAECFAMFIRKDPALPPKMLNYIIKVQKALYDSKI